MKTSYFHDVNHLVNLTTTTTITITITFTTIHVYVLWAVLQINEQDYYIKILDFYMESVHTGYC